MISNIVTPLLVMTGLGLFFGVVLAYALKILKIEVNPTVFKILSKLPGSNCGACGKAGCAGFAEALKNKEAMLSACLVSNDEARRSIAEILGVEFNPKIRTTAVSLCNGGKNAKDKYAYNGIKSCKAASLVFGGQKECGFGCLGFGDCARVCPFGAIKMTSGGLPEVDAAKCTACGNCVRACPKNLFELIPIERKYYVKCSSMDTGNIVIKACKSGCIACMKCEKVCPVGAIKVESNLSRINYLKCQDMGKCFEVCPTKVIARR